MAIQKHGIGKIKRPDDIENSHPNIADAPVACSPAPTPLDQLPAMQ